MLGYFFQLVIIHGCIFFHQLIIAGTFFSKTVVVTNNFLGYDFFFEGEVFHGDKIGRTIGYPTANLKSTDEEKIALGDGIYAVYATAEGKTYNGMMSIGFRPTVNGKLRVTEVNIFLP